MNLRRKGSNPEVLICNSLALSRRKNDQLSNYEIVTRSHIILYGLEFRRADVSVQSFLLEKYLSLRGSYITGSLNSATCAVIGFKYFIFSFLPRNKIESPGNIGYQYLLFRIQLWKRFAQCSI